MLRQQCETNTKAGKAPQVVTGNGMSITTVVVIKVMIITFQPRLHAYGTSLSLPGRLLLSSLVETRHIQLTSAKQDNVITDYPRLAN